MNLLPAASATATGFVLSATLIIAIGAQNAFVLRQALRREHIGTVVLFCALSDFLLMAVGVAGLGGLLRRLPVLEQALTAGGALFLLAYGLASLRRGMAPAHAALGPAAPSAPASRRRVLAEAAAFTLLNPHVYLDTVLLVGSVGAQQPPSARPAFLAGAALASALWFVSLGYGARRLAPMLARPALWRRIELAIGVLMLLLAAMLVLRLLR
ncbi:LysE/ArgO family amino acid transporter [Pseudorhodoferax sp.]|uniref:LysE/ArgO family amino acid transporter n=1 Tax=Pseudorhodoferax sp. TaxID=1993553 RepID=UPI002DD65C4A|nr:LysE family transporter [Pseudorhodoferax sp.]